MKNRLVNISFYSFVFLLFVILLCQIGIIPFRFMYIRTGSMTPTFQPGDLVFLYLDRKIQVEQDDVILFYKNGQPVIHRVARIENGSIITQGDANNTPDFGSIDHAEGKMLFSIPKLGYAIVFFQRTVNSIIQFVHG